MPARSQAHPVKGKGLQKLEAAKRPVGSGPHKSQRKKKPFVAYYCRVCDDYLDAARFTPSRFAKGDRICAAHAYAKYRAPARRDPYVRIARGVARRERYWRQHSAPPRAKAATTSSGDELAMSDEARESGAEDESDSERTPIKAAWVKSAIDAAENRCQVTGKQLAPHTVTIYRRNLDEPVTTPGNALVVHKSVAGRWGWRLRAVACTGGPKVDPEPLHATEK